MDRNCVGVRRRALDQFTAAQEFERGLMALFESPVSSASERQTRRNWFPFRAARRGRKREDKQIRGWLAIVADDIAHENIHDVIVN